MFNNPGPSAVNSYDLSSILEGSTSCQGFARLSHSFVQSQGTFNSLEMAVVEAR